MSQLLQDKTSLYMRPLRSLSSIFCPGKFGCVSQRETTSPYYGIVARPSQVLEVIGSRAEAPFEGYRGGVNMNQ